MKTTLRNILVAVLLVCASYAPAQQVNTLYFLENAPMRHTINPAFQPVSNFYLTLPVIGYTSLWTGTNNWTMSDFLFKGADGSTITPWHPDAPTNWLENKPEVFALDADISTNLFGFGFRIKKNSYLHINVTERILGMGTLPTSIFTFNDLSSGNIGPMSMGLDAMAYTEFALGFSHKINRKWTIGFKLKALTGQAHLALDFNDVALNSSLESLHAQGFGKLTVAAPLKWSNLPSNANDLQGFDYSTLLENVQDLANLQTTDIREIYKAAEDVLKPAGLGAALDLGVTYKPIENLQFSVSVTDVGFMRWHRYASASLSVDTTFNGVDINYGDYGNADNFNSDALQSDVNDILNGYANSIKLSDIEREFPYINMLGFRRWRSHHPRSKSACPASSWHRCHPDTASAHGQW